MQSKYICTKLENLLIRMIKRSFKILIHIVGNFIFQISNVIRKSLFWEKLNRRDTEYRRYVDTTKLNE